MILFLLPSCALADSTIIDMEAKGRTVHVEWESTEDALLTVEIVKDGENQPYASKRVAVSGEEHYGEENIVFESMPEYFSIEAYFSPVSGGTGGEGMGSVYVEDLYTKPVQQLIRSDGSEYEDQYDERYLEFFIDENGNKSFGVLSDQFTVMRTSDLKGNVSIVRTDEDHNGVPEQVEITTTAPNEDAAWLEKLEQIGDGDPAYLCIVEDKGRSIPDYRHPDSTQNPVLFHMMYLDDATEMNNGLLLSSANPPEIIQRRSQSVLEKLLDYFHVFRLETTWDEKNQKASGDGYSIDFDIQGSISIQSILTSARRIEINNDFNFRKIELDGGKINKRIELSYLDLTFMGVGSRRRFNLFLNFAGGQHVKASMSGSMKHTFNFSGQSGGTRIDHMQFHTGNPTDSSAPQTLTLTIGPELEIYEGLTFVDATIWGDAYTTVKLVQGQPSNDSVWHACGTECVEGFPEHQQSLSILARVTYFFGSKEILNKTLLQSSPKKAKEFYHSEKFNTSGEGFCPYKGYKTIVKLLDAKGKPVEEYECSYTPVRPQMMSVASSAEAPHALYIPASNTPVTVQVTYTTPAGVERTMSQQIVKSAQTSEVVFQLDKDEYWLIFDSEGEPVSNMPEAVSCSRDDIFLITRQIPAMANRTFAGWSFKPQTDPTRQVDYRPGDPFWMTDELFGDSNKVTLYPVWEGVSYLYYTVKPEDEKGLDYLTMPWPGVNATHISPMIPQKEGENDYFVGWMDDRNTLPNLPLMPNPYYPESGTLTAWFVNTDFAYPTVSFSEGKHVDVTKVMNMPKPVKTTIGVPFKLPTEIPFMIDLDFWSVDVPQFFVGWSLFENSKIPMFFPGMDFVALKDTTLYAVWVDRPDFYLLSYNANGGSGEPWTGLNSKKISTTIPTRPGHEFAGWVKKADLDASQQPVEDAVIYQPGEPNPFYEDVKEDGKTVRKYRSGTLYAVWNASDKVYTVSFDANEGSDAPGSVTGKKNMAVTIPNQLPKPPVDQPDAQFSGWGISKSGGGKVYQPGESYTGNADITLYAQWNTSELTVYYDANGGNLGSVPAKQTFGVNEVNKQLSSQVPLREGYRFEGWAADPNAPCAQYQQGGLYYGTQSIVLYAVWAPDERYTGVITYNANGGEHAPEAQHVPFGQETALSEQIPLRENHRFMGWAEDQQAQNAYYQPGEEYLFNGDVTFYAVWERSEPKAFTITYHANGGEGAPQPQAAARGETVQLSMDVPVRENHIFMGWASAPDAAQDEYQPGDDFSCQGNVTLYAVWSRDAFKIYTVTYDANGGYEDSVPAAESAFKGEMITLSEHIPTRLHHCFTGWALDPDAKVANFQPRAGFAAQSDTTLYAVWQLNPASVFTVTYHANGGSGAPEAQSGLVGEPVILSTQEPVREHCTFEGWAQDPTAEEAEFTPGQQCVINGAVTLYAVWNKDQAFEHTVTYHANGGAEESVPAAQTVLLGEEVRIPDQKPTRDKHIFLGWATFDAANSPQFDMGETFVCMGDLDLYAVWAADYTQMYAVTYHAYGGTASPDAQMAFNDTRIQLSLQEPQREGCAFLGWASSPTAEAAAYQPGDMFPDETTQPPYASADLYAVWENTEEQIYTVTYNANGGYGEPDPQTELRTKKITLSAEIPVWKAYTFLGWAADPNAVDAAYQPGDEFPAGDEPREDTVLYAVWDRNSGVYSVTYDANQGKNAPEMEHGIKGQPIQLSELQPEREGYVFMGWALENNLTQPVYQPGDAFPGNGEPYENTVLYAVWENHDDLIYTVTYHANVSAGETVSVPQPQSAYNNQPMQLSSLKPERQGFAFLGWNTDSDAETASYLPDAVFPAGGDTYTDTDLYAVWENDEDEIYTVTYDANGSSAEIPLPQTEKRGTQIELSWMFPVDAQWRFMGWGLEPDSMQLAYHPGDMFPGGDEPANQDFRNQTLYAIWDKDPDGIYTVVYDANGGSGAPVSQFTFIGGEILLSDQQPVREEYDFLGWARSKDAQVPDYAPGSAFPGGSDIALYRDTTLYAVWQADPAMVYTVAYDTNGGTGSFEPQSALIGSTVQLYEQKPVRDKMVFLGWSPVQNAMQATLQPGEICGFTQNVTLYAVWEPRCYTISYNANGGRNAPEPQSAPVDTAIMLHDESHNPTRNNYDFLGWAADPHAEGAQYQPGESYTGDMDVTLYAVWQGKRDKLYTVTYHENGGVANSAPQPQKAVEGEPITLSLQRPVYPQHTFGGWMRSSDGTAADFQPGQYYNEYESMDLWALWTTQQRIILFDDNGGSGGPGSQSFLGETVTIASTVPSRAYYRFEGWSLSAVQPQDVCAAPGESFVWPEGNADMQLTLYAVWTYDPSYQPETPDLPATGDSSALMLWIAALMFSCGGALLMNKCKKQSSK